MAKLKYLLLAFRPKTLSAAIVPVISVSAYLYPIDLKYMYYTITSALCIQIATNLFNDALDFKKGADTEDRIGPKRATQSAWLSEKQVLLMAYLFCFLAILLAIPLILKAGLVIILIGIFSLVFAYLYTGGPRPLAYYGMGDLFVFLFFGPIACFGTYYIFSHGFSLDILVLSLQLGMLCTVLIAINNLRDHVSDKKVIKRTLAVIFGPQWVRYEIFILYSISFLLQFYWYISTNNFSFLISFFLIVPTYQLVKNIFFQPISAVYNTYLAKASLIYLLFALSLCGAFLW